MNIATEHHQQEATKVVEIFGERILAVRQALATALWLRSIDIVVRQHWPVMPEFMSTAPVNENAIAQILQSPDAIQELVADLEILQQKHGWQMEPDDCLRSRGVILALRALIRLPDGHLPFYSSNTNCD